MLQVLVPHIITEHSGFVSLVPQEQQERACFRAWSFWAPGAIAAVFAARFFLS